MWTFELLLFFQSSRLANYTRLSIILQRYNDKKKKKKRASNTDKNIVRVSNRPDKKVVRAVWNSNESRPFELLNPSFNYSLIILLYVV